MKLPPSLRKPFVTRFGADLEWLDSLVVIEKPDVITAITDHAALDAVLADAEEQGHRLLIWKAPGRRPWLAIVPSVLLDGIEFEYRLQAGVWTVVALKHMLELPDEFLRKLRNRPPGPTVALEKPIRHGSEEASLRPAVKAPYQFTSGAE